jgi:hypothetical protein
MSWNKLSNMKITWRNQQIRETSQNQRRVGSVVTDEAFDLLGFVIGKSGLEIRLNLFRQELFIKEGAICRSFSGSITTSYLYIIRWLLALFIYSNYKLTKKHGSLEDMEYIKKLSRRKNSH